MTPDEVLLVGKQEREIRDRKIELEGETGDMWGAFAIYIATIKILY